MTAARPDPFRVKIQRPDGTSTISWERPAPVIEPLKRRILEVLEQEGKALVALNTLLFAGRRPRGDRRPQGPDPRRRGEPPDLELRAGQGGDRRPQPDPGGRHGRRPGGGRGDDRRAEQGLRHPPDPADRRRAWSRTWSRRWGPWARSRSPSWLMIGSGPRPCSPARRSPRAGWRRPWRRSATAAVALSHGVTASWTSYVLGPGGEGLPPAGVPVGHLGIKTVIQQILQQAKADSVVDRLRDDLRRKVSR